MKQTIDTKCQQIQKKKRKRKERVSLNNLLHGIPFRIQVQILGNDKLLISNLNLMYKGSMSSLLAGVENSKTFPLASSSSQHYL